MKKVIIYEYDLRNRASIVDSIENSNGNIYSWVFFSKNAQILNDVDLSTIIYIDLSSVFAEGEQIGSLITIVEIFINIVLNETSHSIKIIIDQQYSNKLEDLLYYRIEKFIRLESLFHLDNKQVSNVVDINNHEFDDLMSFINENLFGNDKFKSRLVEELKKFRLFNRIGIQPIFSIFICGPSGIGKTEVARLIHRYLSPDEPFIKINFGNYSSHDALNSLIGSPRGYIGSTNGELPEKLMRSSSKLILIDEFEKADNAVFNFFLQLLEEGKFSDSLGREYDLNKYVIIFTSNISKDRVSEYLPMELRSRFNFKYSLNILSDYEKKKYVKFKTQEYLDQISKFDDKLNKVDSYSDGINIDVTKYSNIRDINNEIIKQLSACFYKKVVK